MIKYFFLAFILNLTFCQQRILHKNDWLSLYNSDKKNAEFSKYNTS